MVFLFFMTAQAQRPEDVFFTPQEIIVKLKNGPPKKSVHFVRQDRLFPDRARGTITARTLGLDRIQKIAISADMNIFDLLKELQNDPQVEYAQVNHLFRLHDLPNDPLVKDQWLVEKIGLKEAWDIETGSAEVIVGIVDTGLDYEHEDLQENIWLNSGEDVNADDFVDAGDFNGIDDDDNGFIDDIRGWDFTDAPHFPDAGDYLAQDNDPMDEHGHGTSVAGIIGAVADNRKGVAGIAHGCRMMNLRAGTSQGLLEEDDVASALVYAVDNGARIINMSFGDVVASPLLHDVMQYAFSQQCILVASAGNSSSADIHYPAGYHETIAVGAMTSGDVLAGFSNYGSTVDLVAPGVSILTTRLHDEYGEFGGTSAAASVVSGVAALVLSNQPTLTHQDVRNILVSSTDDLGEKGWDDRYGAGRINALKALQARLSSEASIRYPALDMGFHQSPLAIIGTASGALIDQYELSYGPGDNPDQWHPIRIQPQRQVIDDTLGTWNFTGSADSSYILRLVVFNKDGSAIEARTRIYLDRTVPRIDHIMATQMMDGPLPSILLEFVTDDVCQSAIDYRPPGSEENNQLINLSYTTTDHRYLFTTERGWGPFDVRLRATNCAGLFAESNLLTMKFAGEEIAIDPFEPLDYHLPPGYMLNAILDFDGDGQKEIVLNEFIPDKGFDRLKIYEFDGGTFYEVLHTEGIEIPRDCGDTDGNGLLELLTGFGSRSTIYECPTIGAYPSSAVWTNDNLWASRFCDLDKDGFQEIAGRTENACEIWENAGDHQFVRVALLPNPTTGSNGTGVPHSEIGDFDGDGRMEILSGDEDGDAYIYEAQGDDIFQFTWNERQPLIDCIDYLSSGDYDGDGTPEFAVGSHSSPELDLEHEYDARHWAIRIYDAIGDDEYTVAWEQKFFGFEDFLQSVNGFSSGDVDDDGRDELLLSLFPDFYVIDYREDYTFSWYSQPSQSNGCIVGDIDVDGRNELFINDGTQISSFRKVLDDVPFLSVPSGFRAWPLDAHHVQLAWNVSPQAVAYLIYRGNEIQQLVPYHRTEATNFTDEAVLKDMTYWYAIQAVSGADSSRLSSAVSVTPGERPYVESAFFIPPNQVRIHFSERMNASIKETAHYFVEGQTMSPQSVLIDRSSQQVIVTLDVVSMNSGQYKIHVRDVFDHDGAPIDTLRNSVVFRVDDIIPSPYLVRAERVKSNVIYLYFSQALDPRIAARIENYRIEPAIPIESVELDPEDESVVMLLIDDSVPIGALGVNYIITVSNVQNQSGIAIEPGQGSQTSFFFYRQDLSDVFTYPNPYRFDEGSGFITFANLTKEATIRIMTMSGAVIRTIYETDGNGGVVWDLKDEKGESVSSGVYLFYVSNEKEHKIGKFAVINEVRE